MARTAILALAVLVLAGILVLFFSLRERDHGDFSVIKPEDGVERGFVSVNGIRLQVATAGPQEGPPVILLHGYPDAHFGWRSQILALTDAGFRVIAPDQRGYNLSDKPRHVENYRMDVLVADVIALADHYELETFNLAGHDFGGIVSWNLAHAHPERLRRMVVLNAPHPEVMSRFQRENAEQRRRSWYAYFFQLPWLPELVTRAGNWGMLARTLEDSFGQEEIGEYRRAWSQPGANTATINWYRALLKQNNEDRFYAPIDVPTLVVWGKQDPHIMWQSAEPSAAMSTSGELVYIEDATHWVLRDAPEETGRLLVDYFSRPD
jgi:pimeloyl-ACP methyl ester carboxylesterase